MHMHAKQPYSAAHFSCMSTEKNEIPCITMRTYTEQHRAILNDDKCF